MNIISGPVGMRRIVSARPSAADPLASDVARERFGRCPQTQEALGRKGHEYEGREARCLPVRFVHRLLIWASEMQRRHLVQHLTGVGKLIPQNRP
jgi:hypothetical protein